MAEDDAQNKTEEPTGKRIEEAAKKGQVPYTKEFGSTLGIVAVVTVIYWAGGMFYTYTAGLFAGVFENLRPWQYGNMPFFEILAPRLYDILALIVLVMLAAFFAPIIGHIAQKGVEPRPEAAKPEINKISPMKGLKKLFSMETVINFAKNFVKALGLLFIYYIAVRPYYMEIAYSAKKPYESALALYGIVALRYMVYAVIFMIIVIILDYYIQIVRTKKQLMMSRQEVKEELKDTEGNPEIRQRVREVQRERSRRQIDKEVPSSTVIITNPTHFAVAIKYDKEKAPVPRVVAKGVDFLCVRIKDIAKKNNVPLVENPPLARAIYREVKVGKDIPRAFYKAVAKILATIMRLEAEKKRKRESYL